jgi:hypothetical protein
MRWLHGLDFKKFDVLIDPALWSVEDGSIELVIPFYEDREVFEFTTDQGGLHLNETLTEPEENWVMGSNIVYNNTEHSERELREMHFAINGRDGSSTLTIEGW